jgi:hypothetical protein
MCAACGRCETNVSGGGQQMRRRGGDETGREASQPTAGDHHPRCGNSSDDCGVRCRRRSGTKGAGRIDDIQVRKDEGADELCRQHRGRQRRTAYQRTFATLCSVRRNTHAAALAPRTPCVRLGGRAAVGQRAPAAQQQTARTGSQRHVRDKEERGTPHRERSTCARRLSSAGCRCPLRAVVLTRSPPPARLLCTARRGPVCAPGLQRSVGVRSSRTNSRPACTDDRLRIIFICAGTRGAGPNELNWADFHFPAKWNRRCGEAPKIRGNMRVAGKPRLLHPTRSGPSRHSGRSRRPPHEQRRSRRPDHLRHGWPQQRRCVGATQQAGSQRRRRFRGPTTAVVHRWTCSGNVPPCSQPRGRRPPHADDAAHAVLSGRWR